MMRSFYFRIFCIGLILFFLFPTMGQSMGDVSAHNAILIDKESGRILYEKNADEQKLIASLTKVMTAIIAIENGNLEDAVIASNRAIYTTGSSIYLQKEETMTLEDLLYGLMLRSGNDASIAIAEHVGGSVEGFVFLMNEKAKYLGLTNTHFANPHGLDEENHYSSAHDVAKLMQYAMGNETFQQIAGTTSYQSDNRTYKWNNKNKLLSQLYDYCTGGKTGFTKKAGRTLVTSAEKDGLHLIAVTLNASSDWNDHISLYEWGFAKFEPKKLVSKGKKKFSTYNDNQMEVLIEHDVIFPLQKEEVKKLKKETIIEQGDQDELGEGKIVYKIDSKPIVEIPIVAVGKNESPSYLETVWGVLKKIIQIDMD